MSKQKISGATIPYQLRPHKAIERNLFIDLLKKLDASTNIDVKNYLYVGFGAAFLEDYKLMHIDLNVSKMDCIEMDASAYTRQQFNKPYKFIDTYSCTSTKYINEYFKNGSRQIVWLDYAMPKELRQQLQDVEIISTKLAAFDILKLTFNSNVSALISSHNILKNGKRVSDWDYQDILNFLKNDATYSTYLPLSAKVKNMMSFASIVRAMALKAIRTGLTSVRSDLKFYQLSTFSYADGQEMTTITGIFATEEQFKQILNETKVQDWPFFNSGQNGSEFFTPKEIAVPAMTLLERMEIDGKMPVTNLKDLAKDLVFTYSNSEDENLTLLNGYHDFYKYLPQFSKVTY